jgi:hypothetical protein
MVDRGRFFFILDSFDEIPAVLDASEVKRPGWYCSYPGSLQNSLLARTKAEELSPHASTGDLSSTGMTAQRSKSDHFQICRYTRRCSAFSNRIMILKSGNPTGALSAVQGRRFCA